jgi:hypothetical protein
MRWNCEIWEQRGKHDIPLAELKLRLGCFGVSANHVLRSVFLNPFLESGVAVAFTFSQTLPVQFQIVLQLRIHFFVDFSVRWWGWVRRMLVDVMLLSQRLGLEYFRAFWTADRALDIFVVVTEPIPCLETLLATVTRKSLSFLRFDLVMSFYMFPDFRYLAVVTGHRK